MTDGPELTNGVAGAVERVTSQLADFYSDRQTDIEAALTSGERPDLWDDDVEVSAADLRTLLAIAADHARLVQATGEARSALEWDRERLCSAAGKASEAFGQWVPQRWVELLIKAYEADQ